MRRVAVLAIVSMLAGVGLGVRPALASTGYGFWNWYLLPSAASLPGLFGTFWRTDLNIVNPYQYKSITVTVKLLKELVDNTSAPERTFEVAPGAELVVADIVKTQFNAEGKGALVVWTEDGSYFTANARTYTGTPGTFGQGINGQSSVSTGRGRAFIAGVRNGGGFRTNIGAVNASATSATLIAEVFDTAGVPRGTKSFSLLPWSAQQVSLDSFAGQFGQGFVRWTCSSTSTSIDWVAYASVVDNASGDAVYLEERPDDVYTAYEPAFDLSGRWEGTLDLNGIGSEAVTITVYQDGALVYGYVYNSATGCREMYLEGYETGGTVTFTGRPYLYDMRSDRLSGTAIVVSETTLTGTFTGTGFYAAGGTFALTQTASWAVSAGGASEAGAAVVAAPRARMGSNRP